MAGNKFFPLLLRGFPIDRVLCRNCAAPNSHLISHPVQKSPASAYMPVRNHDKKRAGHTSV